MSRPDPFLLLALLTLFFAAPANALTQTASPGSCNSESTWFRVAWNSPDNARADDTDYARASLRGRWNSVTEPLVCDDFGFSIPSTATIDGVSVRIKKFAEDSGYIEDNELRLIKGGAGTGSDYADTTTWPDSDSYSSYGGATDLWGDTWNAAEINANDFGITLTAKNTSGNNRTVDTYVNHIEITVHYTDTAAPSTIINTYYPGSTSATAGTTSIDLGPASDPSAPPISTGDLLLIMQMQGDDIDDSNNSTYGDGVSGDPGSGSTTSTAGFYEYLVATNDVPIGGGTLNLGCGLQNSYTNAAASSSSGQKTFQVIRVPVFDNYSLPDLTAEPWNGSTGGVLAFDVTGTLDLNGANVNLDGMGFRGGGVYTSGSGSGSRTDYRTSAASNGANGSKGEGTAGTPRYVFTAPDTLTDTGAEGYPSGSRARGAPGNAGGGATDRNPSSNDQNSGGGGGANGGDGGVGGIGWCGDFDSGDFYYGCGFSSLVSSVNPRGSTGGFGGKGINGLGATKLTLGGGGGGGTANNVTGSGDCASVDGLCSSGAAGGGIIMVRANTMTGSANFTARGSDGDDTVGNDGSGGGAGGGAVLIDAGSGMGGVTIDVSGGWGGSNLLPGNGSATPPHGPGGGGGGGFAITNGTTNSCDALGGEHGVTYNQGSYFGAYGATSGGSGNCTTSLASSSIPGAALGGVDACTVLGHFAIDVGSGTASTCTPRGITISAEDSSNNAIGDYAQRITLSTSSGHGDWSVNSANGALNNGSSDDGIASYTFVEADNGTITLDLSNAHADDLTITVSDGSGTTNTSSTVSFRDNVFVITPSSNYGAHNNSDVMVAGREHHFSVALWRKDPLTGNCAIASDYNGPNRGLKAYIDRGGELTGANAPVMDDDTASDVTLTETVPGSNNITLDFSDTTGSGGTGAGIASFSLKTSDVGSYALHLLDDSNDFATGISLAGDIGLIAAPFGFAIDFNGLRHPDLADGSLDGSDSDNSYAADHSGSKFVAAGSDFDAVLTAVRWQAADDGNNDGIPDAGDNLDLTDNIPVPSFGAESGAHAVSFAATFSDPAEAPGNQAMDHLTADTLIAGGGGNEFAIGNASATATLNFDEAGIIDLSATLNNYLGKANADITGRAPKLGRFSAHELDVTISDATFGPVNGTFTYLGQPFSYASSPSITIIALSAKGTQLQNYEGDYWMLGSDIGSADFSYGDQAGNADSSLATTPNSAIPYGDTSAVGGSVTISSVHAGEHFAYSKPASPTAPFDADVSLAVSLTDSDDASGGDTNAHIGFSNDTLDGPDGTPGTADDEADFNVTNDSTLRYGRAALGDTVREGTSSGTTAAVPLVFEYYDGTDFVANSDDTTSSIAHSAGTPAFYCLDPDTSDTLACADVDIADTTATNGGTFPFSLNSGIGDEGGTLVYKLRNSVVDDWLEFNWDGDSSSDTSDDAGYLAVTGTDHATASVTFAPPSHYHGDERFLYWRERIK